MMRFSIPDPGFPPPPATRSTLAQGHAAAKRGCPNLNVSGSARDIVHSHRDKTAVAALSSYYCERRDLQARSSRQYHVVCHAMRLRGHVTAHRLPSPLLRALPCTNCASMPCSDSCPQQQGVSDSGLQDLTMSLDRNGSLLEQCSGYLCIGYITSALWRVPTMAMRFIVDRFALAFRQCLRALCHPSS